VSRLIPVTFHHPLTCPSCLQVVPDAKGGDGVDRLKGLRSQIGLVSHEPILFATTIKGNVAHRLIGTRYEYASELEKFAMIKGVYIKANADGFIMNLPMRTRRDERQHNNGFV
jgi:hypothetical protein